MDSTGSSAGGEYTGQPADQYPAAAGLSGKFGGVPTYSCALSATLLA